MASLFSWKPPRPTFIDEFDLRPNILFVDYLKYPREVLAMLFTGYKLQLVMGIGNLHCFCAAVRTDAWDSKKAPVFDLRYPLAPP